MTRHRWVMQRPWVLAAIVALLVAGHLAAARYAIAHAELSAAVVSTVAVVMIAKHVGAAVLFGPLASHWRRRAKRS